MTEPQVKTTTDAGAAAGHAETVIQRSPQFGTQIRGQRREREAGASAFRPDIRREIEHAGDADPDPRFLLGGHRLPEGRIGEPFTLLRQAGCEE
jgi:hypothetical protein